MTNLNALKANLVDVHGVVFTDNHYVKALSDQGLVDSNLYSDSVAIDKATIALYDMIIGGAGFAEGGLNYSLAVEGAKEAKAILEKKIGIYDRRNTIKSPKVW